MLYITFGLLPRFQQVYCISFLLLLQQRIQEIKTRYIYSQTALQAGNANRTSGDWNCIENTAAHLCSSLFTRHPLQGHLCFLAYACFFQLQSTSITSPFVVQFIFAWYKDVSPCLLCSLSLPGIRMLTLVCQVLMVLIPI